MLGGILLFGLLIRVYNLGGNPLWIDESTSSMAAKMILDKGVPVFDSGLFYSRALVFHYCQAFMMLFGEGDFMVRFVSVIFGLLTVLLGYFIGKEYSKSGGIIVALFLAVFYLEVFFSRQARMYQLFQLMFFLSLYLLYKAKEKKWLIYPALVSLYVTIDTQIAGLVLCPFFIVFIWKYCKKWLSVFALIPLIWKFVGLFGLSSGESSVVTNYISSYFSLASNMHYLLVFFVLGVVWAFYSKKLLTSLLVVPSLVLLVGVFSLKTFALRYEYFFVFALVVYGSLLFSFLYEKYGKLMLISIFAILIIPSTLFFPVNGINVLSLDYDYYDASAPTTDYKNLDSGLIEELREGVLISYFSSNVEWYIKKPDYVLGFSMNGIGYDHVSYNGSLGVVDVYSGALMLDSIEGDYYVLADRFSVSKLKEDQIDRLNELIDGCEKVVNHYDLDVYHCTGVSLK